MGRAPVSVPIVQTYHRLTVGVVPDLGRLSQCVSQNG